MPGYDLPAGTARDEQREEERESWEVERCEVAGERRRVIARRKRLETQELQLRQRDGGDTDNYDRLSSSGFILHLYVIPGGRGLVVVVSSSNRTMMLTQG